MATKYTQVQTICASKERVVAMGFFDFSFSFGLLCEARVLPLGPGSWVLGPGCRPCGVNTAILGYG